ncbi:MAG: hypothetical protein M0Z41_19675 [Peptococcaceae bacterium]|jgi:hypothetical protein|nr:hypothetical protein [Peptococcaceae bacterium]
MIFATINNDAVAGKFQSLMGVEITGDENRLAECDASLVFSRSPASGLGTGDVRKYLDLSFRAGVPCVLVLNRPDAALMDYAGERGVAGENMVVPVNRRVSAGRLAQLVEPLLQSYEITFDPDGGSTAKAGYRVVLPGRNCVIYGVKGGVGVSTVAAMLAAGLEGVHLEIGGAGRMPTGYCYHGPAPGQTGPCYACWNEEREFPVLEGRSVVVDLNQTVAIGTADEVIAQAGCFILVADRSETAFGLVGRLVNNGLKPDIFAVCGSLPGSGFGCPVEVYKGEYGDRLPEAVVDLPGGLDTERVILGAQRRGVPPNLCPGGEDLTLACGELVSLVRGFIG